MSMNVVAYPNALACRKAAVCLAREAVAQGRRPVLLVGSYSQQLEMQKWLAEQDAGFAVAVTTLFSWICELWELLGDGSAVVGGETRMVALWRLLCESDSLQRTPGVLNLLNRCANQAIPYVGNLANGLSEQEQAAVDLLQRYGKELHDRGYVEYSEALARLAGEPAGKRYAPLLLGVREDSLTHAQRVFLDAWEATFIRNSHVAPCPVQRSNELLAAQALLFQRAESDEPVSPRGALRVALAAGPSASNRITCQAVCAAFDQEFHDVVVAAPNPSTLFDFALPTLAARGATCTLSMRVKFRDTDLGRALIDLGALIGIDDPNDPLEAMPLGAADFAYNPFSSIPRVSAFKADKTHRNDRLTGQGVILSDLAGNAHDSMQGLIGLLEAGDYAGALDILQAYLDRRFMGSLAYHAQQRRALDVARRLCEEGPDLPFGVLMAMAATAPVVVNVRASNDSVRPVQDRSGIHTPSVCDSAGSQPESEQASIAVESPISPNGYATSDGLQVRFMSQAEAANLEPGSTDCVILAELNADKLPIREPENALTTLLAKLGVAAPADPLAQARDTFYGAFEAARCQVVVQRCLNNENGEPAQAATVFEELLDCYRPNPQTDAGMNRKLGIPESLVPYTMQLGEQDVLGNAGASVRTLDAQPQPLVGTVDEAARGLIVLPFRYAEGVFDGVDVSPSQIESYLDCPYNWFAQRRLRLEGLDEGFSPMERGTFMHDILRRFYQRFQAEVQPKVTESTLDDARRIMEEVFAAIRDEQPRGRFGSRYVARTAWERKEQHAVLPKLLDYLDMEVKLLPGFSPRYFEWQFATQHPLPYAGCNLRGCVDRIDVDEHGRAVVIDYKSSLSNEYRLFDARAKEQPESFELPKRLQTLMYARIVREHFGYQMVGALYVNPMKRQVLGAYDAHVLGAEDIPFAGAYDSRNCQVPYPFASTFDELLDTCEATIAERLTHLQAGEIEPNPAHDEACQHCPVNVCPKRRVPRR